jgi:hypothetical protein
VEQEENIYEREHNKNKKPIHLLKSTVPTEHAIQRTNKEYNVSIRIRSLHLLSVIISTNIYSELQRVSKSTQRLEE